MKAIILTYAPVSKEEAELLKSTNVYKIACNNYCAELKPNVRLCADNIVQKCLDCDTCDVISCNYDLDRERVINGCTLPNRHSSLLNCIDYLYLKGYTEVLLVATNPEGTATHKINYNGVNDMKDCLYLYKYSKEGCFDIPYKSVKEFLMQNLTDEEKLLGMTEPRPKTLIEKTAFTDACQYEVHTEGYNNKSIENGNVIGSILPFEAKQQILNGESEITYNGLVIRKLTALVPEKVKEEAKEEKINPDDMTYQELSAYVKERNIKSKSNKKADLIEAIKDSING